MNETAKHFPPSIALPERDPLNPNSEQGLYRKFDVRRTDGSDHLGGKHYGCEYFVLDVTHDPHAAAALNAYQQSVAATHPDLAADMRTRYGLTSDAAQPADVPLNDSLGVNADGIAYRLARELEDLIELADCAMRQANNDGAEYDREEHLLDARNAVRAYKSFLKEHDALPANAVLSGSGAATDQNSEGLSPESA